MAEKEKVSIMDKIIDAGAAVIDFHDNIQHKIDIFFIKAWYGFALFVHKKRHVIHENRAKILQYFALVILTAIGLLSVYNYAMGYEYSYHGKVLGYVKNQDDVIKVLELSSNELSKAHDANIKIEPGNDITFRRVVTLNTAIDSDDTVLNRLTYLTNMRADAYSIYANGKYILALSSKADAMGVIKALKDHYVTYDKNKKTEYQSVGIEEKVGILPESVRLTDISSSSNAADSLISSKALTVKTVEKSTFAEVVKYKTVVKKTRSMYKGDSKVVQKGDDGKRVVTAVITKENGKQTNRIDLKHKTLKSMVRKIVYEGSKTRPKTAPTGTFIIPLSSYTITSPFGSRWGSFHEGVDLAASTGTPIHAADGGTIIRAGWYSGYGKCVEISHGDGFVTRYGHCSEIKVDVGEKVYQGQTIALVGNTGHSYGSHCHFEVRINGSAVNPLSYVNKKYR